MIVRWSHTAVGVFIMMGFAGCGEPMFENAGSPHSLIEDRKTCVAEIDQSSATNAYRENPDAHPEYLEQVFEEMNFCIERKGWKQIRSKGELDHIRRAVQSEAAHTAATASPADPKGLQALQRSIERRLSEQPREFMQASGR